MGDYFVYIMTNNSGTLYVGVTNNLERRVHEHKRGELPGFTQRYKATRLVYYEATPDIRSAIEREKQLKGLLRRKKIALIASMNPHWRDLGEGPDRVGETLRGVYPERSRRAQGDRSVDRLRLYEFAPNVILSEAKNLAPTDPSPPSADQGDRA